MFKKVLVNILEYSRTQNPTRTAYELVADLESGDFGFASSGMSADAYYHC